MHLETLSTGNRELKSLELFICDWTHDSAKCKNGNVFTARINLSLN